MSSDSRSHRTTATTARSGLTRLADAARAAFPIGTVDRAERPVVGVVRGFDAPSRLRARVLRAKLESRGLRPLDLTTLPAGPAGAASPAPPRAPQLLIDSTSRSTSSRAPASQLAARIGIPLVALPPAADPLSRDVRGPHRDTRVVLTAHAESASDELLLLDVALDDLVLRPDSDDARLDVQVEGCPAVEGVPGAVRIRPDAVHPLIVEVSGVQRVAPAGGPAVRLTPRAGHYHVLVDDVPVADLTAGASLAVTTTRLRVVLA